MEDNGWIVSEMEFVMWEEWEVVCEVGMEFLVMGVVEGRGQLVVDDV